MNLLSEPAISWDRLKEAIRSKGLGLAESAFLACLEPNPITGCYEDEYHRARHAIYRGRNDTFVRFRQHVNRNAFLLACLDYTERETNEHLVVGYGFRHGSTTKVTGLHAVLGDMHSVSIPRNVAHAMHDHYHRRVENELLVFHNHPYNYLNLLLNNPPLASGADRCQLEELALNGRQLLRSLAGGGRVLFYLGENGAVKQFRLPNVLTR